MRADFLSVLFAGLLAAACAAAPAHAEKADRNKPINLEADHATVDDAKQIATFTGNVVLEVNTRRCSNRREREADLAEALAFTRLHLAAAVER